MFFLSKGITLSKKLLDDEIFLKSLNWFLSSLVIIPLLFQIPDLSSKEQLAKKLKLQKSKKIHLFTFLIILARVFLKQNFY